MNEADWAILAIILISSLLSLWRGFIREALSLVAWIVAFAAAVALAPQVAGVLPEFIEMGPLRIAAAFILVLITVLVLASVAGVLLNQVVKHSGLSGMDRLLGLIFGLARGGVIVAVLVLLGGLTSMAQEPWWQQSPLIASFGELGRWLQGFWPSDVPVPDKLVMAEEHLRSFSWMR